MIQREEHNAEICDEYSGARGTWCVYIYFILHCYSEYDCTYKQTHNNKIKGTYVGRLISYLQGVGRDIRLCKRRNGHLPRLQRRSMQM